MTDEDEVRDLLCRYSRALDEKDWHGFADLFAQDGELLLPWGEAVPRPRIADDTRHKLGRFAATHHMNTNQQVTVTGTDAVSRSLVQATHVTHDGRSWTLGARYDSAHRRTEAGWRFTRVRLTTVWESGDPPLSTDHAGPHPPIRTDRTDHAGPTAGNHEMSRP